MPLRNSPLVAWPGFAVRFMTIEKQVQTLLETMEAFAQATASEVNGDKVEVHYHLTPSGCYAVILCPTVEKIIVVTTTDDVE